MGIVRYVVLFAFSVFVYYIGAVLFGAPFLSHIEDNLLFAFILSLLTTVPIVWSCGSGAYANETLSNLVLEGRALNKRQFFAYYTAVGSFCGSLVGTVVIPLDWDTYWQKWPIPCIIGAIFGALAGICYSRSLLIIHRGKIVDDRSKLI